MFKESNQACWPFIGKPRNSSKVPRMKLDFEGGFARTQYDPSRFPLDCMGSCPLWNLDVRSRAGHTEAILRETPTAIRGELPAPGCLAVSAG